MYECQLFHVRGTDATVTERQLFHFSCLVTTVNSSEFECYIKDILVVNSLTVLGRSLGMVEIPLQIYFLSRTICSLDVSFVSELDTLAATVMNPTTIIPMHATVEGIAEILAFE